MKKWFFTPRLKIIFPEIIDKNSKIKYKCPNDKKNIWTPVISWSYSKASYF